MLKQLNGRAKAICSRVEKYLEEYDARVTEFENGSRVFDFGVDRLGTFAAGVELARICLSDLAEVTIVPALGDTPWPRLQVVTDHPLNACIASQYAGWPFSTESYFSMCSGPARLARGAEEILKAYELATDEREAVAVFEASSIPSECDLAELAKHCNRDPSEVTVCIAKTSSLPGTMQVVSRSVETALHKVHEIGFDLRRIERAIGVAPIPPIGNDDYRSMGWTNDSVLYGAEVYLWLSYADDIYALADQLPSSTSSDYGRPFIEIFEENDRDFYKVDRKLFSPAKITLHCLTTGRTVTVGKLRHDLLESSFGWKQD